MTIILVRYMRQVQFRTQSDIGDHKEIKISNLMPAMCFNIHFGWLIRMKYKRTCILQYANRIN